MTIIEIEALAQAWVDAERLADREPTAANIAERDRACDAWFDANRERHEWLEMIAEAVEVSP